MANQRVRTKIEKQLERFHEQLSQDIPPFRDTSKKAQKQRYDLLEQGTDHLIGLYMNHYKDSETATFHYDLDAMFAYPEPAVFPVHGPREHAKSVRSRMNVLRAALTGDLKYWVFASETISRAWEHIEYIDFEFTNNHRLSADFDIDVKKKDSQKGIYRVKVKTKATGKSNYFMLQAVSDDTSGKGLLFMQHRPQGAIVDDLEKTKDTYNPENGKKKVDFVVQELWPACTGPVVWLGNMGRKGSALHQVFEEIYDEKELEALKKNGSEPGFFAEYCKEEKPAGNLMKGFIYRADTKLESGDVRYLWPERFSPAWYKGRRRVMGFRYEGEFNGDPMAPGKIFSEFPVYSEIPKDAVWFSWFDPAWGRSKNSSHKVHVTCAFDGHFWYVVYAYCRVGTALSEALDYWYNAFESYPQLKDGGFENTFAQDERMYQDLDIAEERNNKILPVKGYDNPGDKDARILSMDQPVNQGRVLWPEVIDDDLQTGKEQMKNYDPDMTSIPKDFPDALEACINKLRHRWRQSGQGYESLGKRRYSRTRTYRR